MNGMLPELMYRGHHAEARAGDVYSTVHRVWKGVSPPDTHPPSPATAATRECWCSCPAAFTRCTEQRRVPCDRHSRILQRAKLENKMQSWGAGVNGDDFRTNISKHDLSGDWSEFMKQTICWDRQWSVFWSYVSSGVTVIIWILSWDIWDKWADI